ncbi:tyrosine-protein phosphatase [Parahaliea maris]|uniref:tyrosine-protein phosphatase n=1 Tax=Parahaliea maris TaxID=2716870 RepID=UPI0016500906|nr:CpsB/CapC family capsule biosynthesis tyrosine phosphatase [Parahaliea maris]
MIDLHCHFLPGIDDGAANLDEALALARASVDNGVRCAIMTPHLHPGRWENFADEIARHTQRFRAALAEADIPLKVGFAAEVRLSPEIPGMIEQGRVPFLGEMGGYRIMLLEFPHGHIPLGADKLVARLLKMRVRPVIAHPERNKDVMRDPGKLAPFIDMGCILQLTAASVCGRFGERAQRTALSLLETDADKLLASDAHNVSARPPLMREGMAAAAQVVGDEAAGVMAHSLPLRIVASQFRKPVPSAPATPANRPASLETLLVNLIDERLQRQLGGAAANSDSRSGEELARQYHRELVRLLDGQVTRWVQRELRRATARTGPQEPISGPLELSPGSLEAPANRDRSPINK